MATRRNTEPTEKREGRAFEGLVGRIAENLLRLRKTRAWTQEEAAGACGVAPRHYQQLEAGDVNLTARTLARLSTGFEVDPLELLVPRKPGSKRLPGRPSKK